MECLRNLLKDYKNEIDDMLVADKQLRKRLIYDMQKCTNPMKAKSAAAGAVTTMQRPDLCYPTKCSGSCHISVVAQEVNRGTSTPPLSAMKAPRLKSHSGGPLSRGDKPPEVIESLRRRQNFDSDEEN
ncbi:hypothetical protein HAX54_052317 [Datura stramonium]|uniref:Uncharacterized protein n=1 Tax=Datura stramonium TaxID=4076 RepID=A0ABS8SZD8_DATST|nr:hypothetical protein [Datura stramonium]